MENVCEIVNDQFSYILKVDDKVIRFNYQWNAEYFAEHYSSLGYKIVKVGW